MQEPIPAPPTPPLGDRGTWAAVMRRAGYRCQCTHPHPKHRRGRCEVEHGGTIQLIAAPADPRPADLRHPRCLPADALVAWCATCYDLAIKSAARAKAQRTREVLADTLF